MAIQFSKVICLVLWIISLQLHVVNAKYNKIFSMPSDYVCGSTRKEIDGAVILSDSADVHNGSPCVVRLEADDSATTSKRIMLNLTDVHISDCLTKLSVYFNSNGLGSPDYTLSCGSQLGVVVSTTKYVTLRLDGKLSSIDHFQITATTFKRKSHCSEFKCDNGYCIDTDLLCDKYDHCFDGSDEVRSAAGYCVSVAKDSDEDDSEDQAKQSMTIYIVAVAVGVFFTFSCIMMVVFWVRIRGTRSSAL